MHNVEPHSLGQAQEKLLMKRNAQARQHRTPNSAATAAYTHCTNITLDTKTNR